MSAAASLRFFPEWQSAEGVFTGAVPAHWQAAPGSVLRKADGSMALHIAPRRWLLLSPNRAWYEDIAASGALLFDTQDRYSVVQMPLAHPALAAAVDTHSVLLGRECAAVTLFDMPAVIAIDATRTLATLAVPASFADSFVRSIARQAG